MSRTDTVSQTREFRRIVIPGTLAEGLHFGKAVHSLHREGNHAALVTDIPGHRVDRGDFRIRRARGHRGGNREDSVLRLPRSVARGVSIGPPRNIGRKGRAAGPALTSSDKFM